MCDREDSFQGEGKKRDASLHMGGHNVLGLPERTLSKSLYFIAF